MEIETYTPISIVKNLSYYVEISAPESTIWLLVNPLGSNSCRVSKGLILKSTSFLLEELPPERSMLAFWCVSHLKDLESIHDDHDHCSSEINKQSDDGESIYPHCDKRIYCFTKTRNIFSLLTLVAVAPQTWSCFIQYVKCMCSLSLFFNLQLKYL